MCLLIHDGTARTNPWRSNVITIHSSFLYRYNSYPESLRTWQQPFLGHWFGNSIVKCYEICMSLGKHANLDIWRVSIESANFCTYVGKRNLNQSKRSKELLFSLVRGELHNENISLQHTEAFTKCPTIWARYFQLTCVLRLLCLDSNVTEIVPKSPINNRPALVKIMA